MSVPSSGIGLCRGWPRKFMSTFFCLRRACHGLVFFLKISPLIPHSVVLMAAAIMFLVLSTRCSFVLFLLDFAMDMAPFEGSSHSWQWEMSEEDMFQGGGALIIFSILALFI